MQIYYVIQPDLTDAQAAAVNLNGWDATLAGSIYAQLTAGRYSETDNRGIGLHYVTAVREGLMRHGWTVAATDLNEVFSLANYMGGKGTASKAHRRAKSMSVGDVVIYYDAVEESWVGKACAPCGFRDLPRLATRRIADNCPRVAINDCTRVETDA